MKTDLKELNSFTRELAIHIPWDDLEKDYEKAVSVFSKKIKIAGFRKGKVPKHVVMKNYQPVIEADFIEDSFQKFYFMALQKENLQPVNRADVKDLDFKHGEHLSFQTVFEIEPEIKLPTMKKNSLKVEKTHYVTDKTDIDIAIDEIRRTYAEVMTVEDGAVDGDYILADLQKLDAEGVPIIGDKIEKRYIKLGDGIFTGDNLKKLTGLKPDDTTRIDFPGESGESTLYEITVTNVERQVLPEVTEDLIKKVDPNVENKSEWKKKIKEQIDKNYEQRAKETYERQLSDALIDLVNPEAPPSMVDSYLERLAEDVKKQNNGEEIDEIEVKKMYRSVSERNLKWYLIRKAIIREQSIEVSKDEVNEEIQTLKERSPEHVKEIDKYYKKPSNRSRIEDDLMEGKILDYIQAFAKVKITKVKTKDLRKKSE